MKIKSVKNYMAIIRNLRNILEAHASLDHITKVAMAISDSHAVKHSRQLPFRFLSAYREIQENSNPHTSMILNALEDAVLASAANIKGYDYDTTVLIACDVSGSMFDPVSPKSKVRLYDIGLMLGMLLQCKCKSVITGVFGTLWCGCQLPQRSILQNTMQLYDLEGQVGYATNGWKVLDYLTEEKIAVDKIMMFSDCQLWDTRGTNDKRAMVSFWSEYKRFNPAAKLYLFDLAGYGNTPLKVNNNDVFLISGWSDAIFDVLAAIEDRKSAIDLINKNK